MANHPVDELWDKLSEDEKVIALTFAKKFINSGKVATRIPVSAYADLDMVLEHEYVNMVHYLSLKGLLV